MYETTLDVQLRTNVGGAVIKISKLRRAEAMYYIGMIKISTTVGIVWKFNTYHFGNEYSDTPTLLDFIIQRYSF